MYNPDKQARGPGGRFGGKKVVSDRPVMMAPANKLDETLARVNAKPGDIVRVDNPRPLSSYDYAAVKPFDPYEFDSPKSGTLAVTGYLIGLFVVAAIIAFAIGGVEGFRQLVN